MLYKTLLHFLQIYIDLLFILATKNVCSHILVFTCFYTVGVIIDIMVIIINAITSLIITFYYFSHHHII